VGTSGAIQPGLPLDSILISKYAIGFDTLMQFYQHKSEQDLHQQIATSLKDKNIHLPFYTSMASERLFNKFSAIGKTGITITNPGFYGPQSRKIRLPVKYPNLMENLINFEWQGNKITNLEMETAGIYSLANLLGHRAISLNALIANRATGQFSSQAEVAIDGLIQKTLHLIADKL